MLGGFSEEKENRLGTIVRIVGWTNRVERRVGVDRWRLVV